MLIAMSIAAALCIGVGVFPGALYAMLPYAVDYAPYTSAHVLTQLQLLVFSALAFSARLRALSNPVEVVAAAPSYSVYSPVRAEASLPAPSLSSVADSSLISVASGSRPGDCQAS